MLPVRLRRACRTAGRICTPAALRCRGGDMQVKLWPRDETERKRLIKDGFEKELNKVYYAEDLAGGDGVVFCATGISDSPLLPGVRFVGHTAITHSISMRAKTRTVRYIKAVHDLTTKTIRLRSTRGETAL